MYIAEPAHQSRDSEQLLIEKRLLEIESTDNLDDLVEELRDEYKLELAREAAEKAAARRKRNVVLAVLIAPIGLLIAAALVGKAIHPRTQNKHHESHFRR
jgi:hypothetical protein